MMIGSWILSKHQNFFPFPRTGYIVMPRSFHLPGSSDLRCSAFPSREYKNILRQENPLDRKDAIIYALDTMTGKELKQARLRLNMTQKELGEALGVHKNSVARMERGEFPIIRTTELAVKYLLVMESKKGGRKK